MKRCLFVFCSILVGLFIVLSVLGKKGEYAAEKVLWSINQQFDTATRDPESTPAAQYDTIVVLYDQFIEKYPDSNLIPAVKILAAKVLVYKKDYDLAVKRFEAIMMEYRENKSIQVQVLAEIGRAYAYKKDDKMVMATYKRIWKDFPKTDLGLRVPLLIAEFYANRNQIVEAKNAFQEAVDYYKKLTQDQDNPFVELNSWRLLSACFVAQENWSEAIEAYKTILIKFPEPQYLSLNEVGRVVKSINALSVIKLKNEDLAIDVYKEFIKIYPDHPFTEKFRQIIDQYNKLKAKAG